MTFLVRLDGQTCHRVSIVPLFFSPITSQGLFLPPYYTYFTGSTFAIAKILSTLDSLYLFRVLCL